MIQPDYLQPGDKIMVIAPARKVIQTELEPGVNLLRKHGFEVILAQNVYAENNQFAGTDNLRAADLQNAIDRHDIKAIICARGGYGVSRIIDDIDMAPLVEYPKWLIGFSDITTLHMHAHHNIGMETLHANMLINFTTENFDAQSFDLLITALTGNPLQHQWQTELSQIKHNRNGHASGELIGGNLSLLYANAGTGSDIDYVGKVLFIEDVDEYLYHIDRMMIQLKRSGKLAYLAGLVVGSFSKMQDNAIPFGSDAFEIIKQHVSLYEYPVAFGLHAGHCTPNLPLIMGREVNLTVADENCSLIFEPSND
ncbi:MAG: LD-carboxypeptidase [Bacteroidia bacterium]|nr:LD-carboxypeptidase [Bacteroidia bacterium]